MKCKKIVFIIFLFVFIELCFNISLATELSIECPSAILINADNGKILYEKNSNQTMYPASTTKIMTAILTLEKCKLTDEVLVNSSAILAVPDRSFKSKFTRWRIFYSRRLSKRLISCFCK